MRILRLPRYLGFFAAIALLLWLAAVGFVLLVDPQGLYRLVAIDGFNAKKAYQRNYTAAVKAFAIRRYRPDTLIFGASTVERGVVPECRDPSVSGVSRIYNDGGDGEDDWYFAEANPDLAPIDSLRRLEIETRFVSERFAAGGGPAAARPPEPAAPLRSWATRIIRPWLPAQYAAAYAADLFSIQGIVLSAETVAANRTPEQSTLFRGFAPDGAYDQRWLRHMVRGLVTEYDALDHVRNYENVFLRRLSSNMTIDFQYVDDIAADAGRHGRSVDFFMPPEHVVELLLYREAGLWPLYEKFKLGLVEASDAAQKRYGVEIRVFDFGTLNRATLQPVRPDDLHSIDDPYFADPIHFQKIVGDYILATMLGCKISDPVPADFGLAITDTNIGDHLAAERAKLEAYRRDHADLVKKIAAIVSRDHR